MTKRKLIFVTNNPHKLEEIRKIVGESIEIYSLKEINCLEEIPETADTIRDNAIMKAQYVAEKYGVDCFADDTGLEVSALGGAPGVHTARYASAEGHDTIGNMQLLLQNLKGETDRSAQFVTYIALIIKGEIRTFDVVCKGTILTQMQGNEGFGYDPLFFYEPLNKSFGELSIEEKNQISHRGIALKKLRTIIEELL